MAAVATREKTKMSKRVTLYAAFFGEDCPAINVYGFDRKRLETLVSDRIANGEAHPSERVVRCTLAFYRSKLEKHGLPVPGAVR